MGNPVSKVVVQALGQYCDLCGELLDSWSRFCLDCQSWCEESGFIPYRSGAIYTSKPPPLSPVNLYTDWHDEEARKQAAFKRWQRVVNA